MIKLRIVTEVFYPEVLASSGYILTKLSKSLAKNYIVNVLAGPPNYSGGSLFSDFPLKENYENMQIVRLKSSKLDKNKLIPRILRVIMVSFALLVKVIKTAKKDEILIFVTNPQILLFFGLVYAKIRKIPTIVLVHDVFPENLHATGILSKKSFLYFLVNKVFNFAYKCASVNIVLGRDMKDVIDKKIKKNTSIVIPNWSETETIFPKSKENNSIIKKFKLSEKIIFQFAGNLGRAQGLDFVLKCVKEYKNTKVNFIFAGLGSYADELLNAKRKFNLENMVFLGEYNRSEQLNVLNACDVSIVSLSEGMYGLGVPSKSYNIMAAGNPILFIGDSRSEIALLIKEFEIGWVLNYGDLIGFKKIVQEIESQPNVLVEMGKKARELAETEFTFDTIFLKYKPIIENIFNARLL